MSAGFLVFILGLLVVLALASALFSAFETGIFSIHPERLKRLETTHPAFASQLASLLENPRRLLSTILFGDAVTNLPLIILCLFLVREVVARKVPFWITALVIFAFVVLLCDLIPKVVALARPIAVSRVGVSLLSGVIAILDPLSLQLQRLSERIADFLTPKRFQPRGTLSEAELETLVELSAEEGSLHAAESEMIQEIIKLGDKTVKDCMVPRTETFAVPDDLSNDELIPKLRARRHRLVPVYADTPDEILGVLNVKQFLFDPSAHYTEVIAPPSYVPETMKALDLLRSFLHRPQGMAIIVDEFGGTEGIVTLSDIIEEIISDAVPTGDRVLFLEALGDGQWLVNAAMRLDEVGEELGVEFEEEGIDTIGGLVFNRLGYLPPPGTQVVLNGLAVTVRRTSRKRIRELVIERHEESSEAGEEE